MHKMVVLAKAIDGRSDELARWYDETHLNDLLAVPGLVHVERHTITPVKQPAAMPAYDFLMIYDLAGDDPMAVLREMAVAQVPVACDALDSRMTVSLVAVSQVSRGEAPTG